MPDKPAASKGEKPVGKVEHYYPKAKAAAVGLSGDLKVGDEIHIVGHGDDVRKKVTSLQIDHQPIQAGRKGDHVGVGLASKVHEGDDVLLVTGAKAAPKAAKKAAAKPKAKKAAKKAPRKKAKAKSKKAKKASRKKPSKARGKKARKGKGKKGKSKGKKGKR